MGSERAASDGRITLVIVDEEGLPPVRTLWAVMDAQDLATAREAQRQREGTGANKPQHIAGWQTGDEIPPAIPTIADWAKAHGIDAVVWTALPPKFNNEERIPSEDEILTYLRGLRSTQRDNAERYIRLAPRQIDTPYRRRIEAELNWIALDNWPDDRA